jgi:hypothetical protein
MNDPKSISEAMLKRNLANIAKRLNEGKTLTRAEIELIQSTDSKTPKTDREYARLYGCNPKTIQRAREAGAPLDDVDAMSAWFAARKNSPAGSSGIGGKAEALADAKLEKVLEEIKRIRIKNDIDLKRVIPIGAVQRDMVRIGNAFRSELLRVGGDVPNWEGLPAADMQKRWDEIMERLCSELSNSFSELYDDPDKQSG